MIYGLWFVVYGSWLWLRFTGFGLWLMMHRTHLVHECDQGLGIGMTVAADADDTRVKRALMKTRGWWWRRWWRWWWWWR